MTRDLRARQAAPRAQSARSCSRTAIVGLRALARRTAAMPTITCSSNSEAIAADTGGAIVGNKIDLCMESYDEAIQFGRRNVEVYVLE